VPGAIRWGAEPLAHGERAGHAGEESEVNLSFSYEKYLYYCRDGLARGARRGAAGAAPGTERPSGSRCYDAAADRLQRHIVGRARGSGAREGRAWRG
jgi:hypothetical protein